MRTVIFKPLLLILFFFATSIISLNAIDANGGGQIKIDVHTGFTIEDIIQDLHNNANITNVSVTNTTGTVYILKFNPKQVNVSALIQFLDGHSGVDIILLELK
ncbi:MAG: hypothetical protein ACJA1N_002397 [Saprospiraceae bacterium]|jgi:hypothetical protein|tara:strand:- start:147 stop:455 length:309 start_codon:yes stop_codon:yes gene_type:complete